MFYRLPALYGGQLANITAATTFYTPTLATRLSLPSQLALR